MKRLLLLASLAILSACQDQEGSRRALEGAGYTGIRLSRAGFFWNGCSDRDTYATHFEAVGPTGRVVSGEVCGNIFAGSVIRTE